MTPEAAALYVKDMAAKPCQFQVSARARTCADIFFGEEHYCDYCRARRVLNNTKEEARND